jgi:hypothetical protein
MRRRAAILALLAAALGAPPAPADEPASLPFAEPAAPEPGSRFALHGYGRAGLDLGTDLRGARPLDLVEFPPRLGKQPYQELSLVYDDILADVPVRLQTTAAMNETVLGAGDDFDASAALAELYAEVEPARGLSVWAGARRFLRDNVYILDLFPLREDTLGGGAAIAIGDLQKLEAHAGLDRLDDRRTFFQLQPGSVPGGDDAATRRAAYVGRFRETAALTYRLDLPLDGVDLEAEVHGEATWLPAGERLPADRGFLLGGVLGAKLTTGPLAGSFASLFARSGHGLASFGPQVLPSGFDDHARLAGAERQLAGLNGALESGIVGVHFAAYGQRFRDARRDGETDFQELEAAARPLIFLGKYFRAGFEAVWQARREAASGAGTGRPKELTRLTLLAGVAPKPELFSKPDLLVFFGWSWPDRAAEEPSFGFVVEWWF